MSAERFDAVVLGSGQAGKPLTLALARAGWKVALVEREHVGGTCINVGCTPTKTMIASARVAYLERRGADYGVNLNDVTVNLPRVVARKQAMVERFRNYGQKKLEEADNVELIFGAARFFDAKTVEVRLNAGGSGAAAVRRGAGGGAVGVGQGGNVYAGNDGNVYRREGGSWQQYDNGNWSNTPNQPGDRPASTERAGTERAEGTAGSRGSQDRATTDQLNRDARARAEGAQRTRDAGSYRSGASSSRAGSYRGGGGRGGGGRRL